MSGPDKTEKPKHVPLRMCVVCRALKPKADLFRFGKAETGARLALDSQGGRGLYLCREIGCLDRLQKERRLRKLFLDRFCGEDLGRMRSCLEQPDGR